jgi:hypothetical protein
MLGNLCLSVVLLLLASALRAGDPLARRITIAIGAYYVLLGAATYAFSPQRPAGMLVFSALGIILLGTLWMSR